MTTIILTIVRAPGAVQVPPLVAHGPVVTVGRGADCDWVLPGTKDSLSRTHCRLELMAGEWQVRDLSTYGTFLNLESDPIGRECLRPLRPGDRLRMGDYEVQISLESESAGERHSPFTSADAPSPLAHARGFGGVRLPGLDDPIAPDDPYRPFDARTPPADASPFGAFADHSPATSDAFKPPAAVAGVASPPEVPDDWFRSMLMPSSKRSTSPSAPVSGSPSAAPPVYSAHPPIDAHPPCAVPSAAGAAAMLHAVPDPLGLTDPSTPMRQPQQATAGPAATSAPSSSALPGLLVLLAAAGLPENRVPQATQDPDRALRQAGALLQAVVAGLRALLMARSLVKRGFRIEQTLLKSRDNNPLKFAASDELALASLLDPHSESLQAVREAIDDLTEHEIAVMSATQSAALAMLGRLAPAALEDDDPGGGLLPGAQEKRLWASYKRRHAQLVAQLDDDFDSAFGTAFARAYEQAIESGGRR